MKIKSINPQEMILENDSKWRFLGISPHPAFWQVGDDVVPMKKGEKFSLYRIINKTRQDQEAEAFPISMPCISSDLFGHMRLI